MIKSFKSHSTRRISEFTGGFDPSSACVSGTSGSNDDRLRNLGFTMDGANVSIGASCLAMNGSPTDMHAVVVTGVNTLMPSFLVEKCDHYHATAFMEDLAGRLKNRIQLSSDALGAYADAVE